MKCTFDQIGEYCPLESQNKGNTRWKLASIQSVNNSNLISSPISGKRIYVCNALIY
jgi:hypothetical protein